VIVLVMGVAGSGKTTVGKALAHSLGLPFCDADDLHPAENIAKMKAGVPLTDEDRRPWLRALAEWADGHRAAGTSAVLACSALKRSYRDAIREGHDDVRLIYLRGPKELLASRLSGRFGHFFAPRLLDDQVDTLEEPTPDEHPLVVNVSFTVAQMVSQIAAKVRPGGPRNVPDA
jgi:gluconokinase